MVSAVGLVQQRAAHHRSNPVTPEPASSLVRPPHTVLSRGRGWKGAATDPAPLPPRYAGDVVRVLPPALVGKSPAPRPPRPRLLQPSGFTMQSDSEGVPPVAVRVNPVPKHLARRSLRLPASAATESRPSKAPADRVPACREGCREPGFADSSRGRLSPPAPPFQVDGAGGDGWSTGLSHYRPESMCWRREHGEC